MASRRNPRSRRSAYSGKRAAPRRKPSRQSARRPSRKPSRRPRRSAPKFSNFSLSKLFQKKEPDFRPDELESSTLSKLYMTKLQRLHLLKWSLLVLLCISMLVIQDVIMSRVTVFGTTTDLVAAVLLLITVMEGTDIGSIFIVIASTLYHFSGYAPGPFAVGVMSILGIFATLFRQAYWHRNRNSIILCAGLALMLYEIGIYAAGVLTGLTNWYRIPAFLMTGILSWIVMIPLYPLIDRIGQIGGSTWRE